MPAPCPHVQVYLANCPDPRCVSCGAHLDVELVPKLRLAAAVLRNSATGPTSVAAMSASDLDDLAELFDA